MDDSFAAHAGRGGVADGGYNGGYGGFGYNPSHAPGDEGRSELFVQARQGNLDAVRRIVERAASDDERRRVVNHARRCTGVDYGANGFAKEREWFDVTPLTVAALTGHHEIVQYLLGQGADPTLSGGPRLGVCWDALGAAQHALNVFGKSASDGAGPRRCLDLLELANLFWDKTWYSGQLCQHYSASSRKEFDNKPRGGRGLFLALAEIPGISYYHHEHLDEKDLERLKEKYWEEETEEERGHVGTASKFSFGTGAAPFVVGTKTNNQNKKGSPLIKPTALAFGGTGAANAANQTATIKPAFQFGKPSRRAPTPVAAAPLFGSSTTPKSNTALLGGHEQPVSTPVSSAPLFGSPLPGSNGASMNEPFQFGGSKNPTPASSFSFSPRTPQTAQHTSYSEKAGNDDNATSNRDDASIERALALLESVPTASLTRHLHRLQRLTHTTHELSGAPTYKAVFGDCNLLGHILGFEGCLAYYHKNYDVLVGYESPLPCGESDEYNEVPEFLKYRAGSRSHLLVCKKWKDFVVGDSGLAQWKLESEKMVAKEISLATTVSQDSSLSWSARICAWSIANDTDSLKTAFREPADESKGIGAALVEQMEEGFKPIDSGHPFYRHCLLNIVEDEDDRMYAFTAEIAYAAALVGSTGALRFIETLNSDLWSVIFDQKGDGLVNCLVRAACRNPTLNCIVDSISFILSSYNRKRDFGDMLHQRHYGGNGNHLHLAAARGHASLVKVLIGGGMQPNRSCERIVKSRYDDWGQHRSYDDDSYDDCDAYDSDQSEEQYGDPRDKGVKDNPLPIHWAAIRGHEGIVNLIHSMNGYDDRVKERGRAKAFNHGRGFGFIKREKGGKDIFVHISNIDDGEPLKEGEYVEFVTGQTARGFQALEVERVEGNYWY